MDIKIIEDWISNSIHKETWKNYSDLHIDVIYNKPRKMLWVKYGLKLLNFVELKLLSTKYIAILAISLKDTKNMNNDITSIGSITPKSIGDSPPSIYIFSKNWPPWKETLQESKLIQKDQQGSIYLRVIRHSSTMERIVYIVPTRRSASFDS